MNKALFILSGNLSTTPRALKSILLASNTFKCKVIAINRSPYWLQKDQELIKNWGLDVIILNLGRKPFIKWLSATILEKLSHLFYPILTQNIAINSSASNKSSTILWSYLIKKDFSGYSIILGHSAGSLYPAYKLSQKWNIPFIFDIEDYHPGEFIRSDAKNEKARREFLMKTLLPKATAITSASPLIGKYTMDLIGGHPNHTVILNSFPQSEFNQPKLPVQHTTPSTNLITYQPTDLTSSHLRLIWFSQKISFGRGLEQLFEALTHINTSTFQHFNLTLIGDLDPKFNEQIIQPFTSHHSPFTIYHIPPLSQPALHAELANHDIGLALEPGKDLNNNLAISNKIIAYAQAGLYILATDTPAQQQFMNEHKGFGWVCGQTSKDIYKSILTMSENIARIKEDRIDRFKNGKELAWEKEREKLTSLWQNI